MNNPAPAITVRMDGRDWTVTTYVDPYPTHKGTDKVPVECGMCTNGVYTGRSGYHWQNRPGGADTTWCFWCNGSNRRMRTVSRLRREAKEAAVWREHGDTIRAESAAKQAAANAVILAAQFAEHWDEAHAEQARRAALVVGFVADIGEKVDAFGVVDVCTSFEVPSFSGYGTDWKALVVVTLDDGHVVKTTGTGRTLYGHDRGDRVRVRGTVKATGAYRGQDQTILTRAKIDPAS